jgi:hypothetical protein
MLEWILPHFPTEFEFQQQLLDIYPTGKTDHGSIATDHPMTWNNNS